MGKIIRPTYPAQFSAGLLLLIFILAAFLSQQIFDTPFLELHKNKDVYVGMILAGMAVVIMILILWEEFLFPIKAKIIPGGLIFRNHRTKLVAQLIIYLTIPAIFTYIYLNYEINQIRFFVWAGICVVVPVIEKIISGINNYHDFLLLTNEEIEYKNNEKVGAFKTKDIVEISVAKDESSHIKNMKLIFTNQESVVIDLDEMELEAFYQSIEYFVTNHYSHLLKEA